MRLSVWWKPLALCCALAFPLAACSDDAEEEGLKEIRFAEPGPLVLESGKGSFAFGAATAATQIEDQNTRTDWYFWSDSVENGGKGQGKDHVGDAVGTFSNPELDLALIQELGLDDYRFSIEWARIEPERDVIDEAALQHYSDFIDALIEMGVRPSVTIHHFSNPIWVVGENMDCGEEGPTDENLCGWDHPEGVELIIEELAEHAALLAERFGDRVDNWVTFNEPVNYIIASYGAGYFPPGRSHLISSIGKPPTSEAFQSLVGLFRNFLKAHVAVYDAIHANDTVDATQDGRSADVGMTLNTVEWKAARNGAWSDRELDLAAAVRIKYLYHHLLVDALLEGNFDPALTGEGDEPHPDWEGKLDWLGIQYYFHAGVTGKPAIIPSLDLMICHRPFDFGACVPQSSGMNKWIPSMGYEYDEVGLYTILSEFSARYPDLPLVVTEAGIAANNGRRRAENIVRSFEQMERAMAEGADIRGYYHWSLTDNFEWHEGYGARFGLYSVNLDTFERTPSLGAKVYRDIIAARAVTVEQREEYGGVGPMTPETDTVTE